MIPFWSMMRVRQAPEYARPTKRELLIAGGAIVATLILGLAVWLWTI